MKWLNDDFILRSGSTMVERGCPMALPTSSSMWRRCKSPLALARQIHDEGAHGAPCVYLMWIHVVGGHLLPYLAGFTVLEVCPDPNLTRSAVEEVSLSPNSSNLWWWRPPRSTLLDLCCGRSNSPYLQRSKWPLALPCKSATEDVASVHNGWR